MGRIDRSYKDLKQKQTMKNAAVENNTIKTTHFSILQDILLVEHHME